MAQCRRHGNISSKQTSSKNNFRCVRGPSEIHSQNRSIRGGFQGSATLSARVVFTLFATTTRTVTAASTAASTEARAKELPAISAGPNCDARFPHEAEIAAERQGATDATTTTPMQNGSAHNEAESYHAYRSTNARQTDA